METDSPRRPLPGAGSSAEQDWLVGHLARRTLGVPVTSKRSIRVEGNQARGYGAAIAPSLAKGDVSFGVGTEASQVAEEGLEGMKNCECRGYAGRA